MDWVVRANTFTHAPCVGGAVWDSGMFLPYGYPCGLLPTKTSWLFNQFSGGTPCCQVKVLSPALMVGKLGCVPGACTSDGWCGYIWLCLVLCTCQVVCFFCKWAVRAVSPDELSLNQASSFYFTSGCVESTHIVVILYSLRLRSSRICRSGW